MHTRAHTHTHISQKHTHTHTPHKYTHTHIPHTHTHTPHTHTNTHACMHIHTYHTHTQTHTHTHTHTQTYNSLNVGPHIFHVVHNFRVQRQTGGLKKKYKKTYKAVKAQSCPLVACSPHPPHNTLTIISTQNTHLYPFGSC